MLKDILISMIIWVVVGCGNGSGVKRLDTRVAEKKQLKMTISQML